MTSPGTANQTAAAVTSEQAKSRRPKPSRRCSGSRSRAVRPMLRAVAPSRWARPSQTAATPWPTAPNVRAIGPGPVRTARGAGRRALDERAGLRLVVLPVLRDRALVPLRELLREEPFRDVLEFRDPGGE